MPQIDPAALSKTPWVVGAVAILAGLALSWFGSVITAFGHQPPGFGFRPRLLLLLGPGAPDWAVAILIAVALLVLGSAADEKRSPVVSFVYQILLLAAALIALASAINAIIELSFFGDSFDIALSGFFEHLAGVPIAAAAGLWAWRAHPMG